MAIESSRQTEHDAIRELLLEDPICHEIAAYLAHHTRAVDSARGIAEWWINRDPGSTERALDKLARHGVVRMYVNGPVRIFAYSKNPLTRRAVAACVRSMSRESDGAEG